MKRFKLFAAAAALGLFAASTVANADTYDWTGASVGLYGGYDWLKPKGIDQGLPKISPTGGSLGGQFLYQRELSSSLVLGGGVDITAPFATGSISVPFAVCNGGGPVCDTVGKETVGWKERLSGDAFLSAGYAFDNVEPYAKVGVGFAKFANVTNDSYGGLYGAEHFTQNSNGIGTLVGLGVKVGIGNNMVLDIGCEHRDLGISSQKITGPWSEHGSTSMAGYTLYTGVSIRI